MKYIPKYQNPYQPLVPLYKSFQEADADLNQAAYNSSTGDRKTYSGGWLKGPVISAANTPEGYRSDIRSLREDLLNTSPTLHSQVPRKYDKYKISDRLSTNAPAVDPATRGLINIAQGVAELPQWVAPLPFVGPVIKGAGQGAKQVIRGLEQAPKYIGEKYGAYQGARVLSKLQNPKYVNKWYARATGDVALKKDPVGYILNRRFEKPWKALESEANTILQKIFDLDYKQLKTSGVDPWEVMRGYENRRDVINMQLEKIVESRKNLAAKSTGFPVDFSKSLGKGHFGQVHPTKRIDKVVKFGNVPEFETLGSLEEIAKVGQQNLDKSLGIPTHIHQLGNGPISKETTFMQLMDPVKGRPLELGDVVPAESISKLAQSLEDLRLKGVHFDYLNPKNIMYDPATKRLGAIDFNTTPPTSQIDDFFHRRVNMPYVPSERLLRKIIEDKVTRHGLGEYFARSTDWDAANIKRRLKYAGSQVNPNGPSPIGSSRMRNFFNALLGSQSSW